MTLPAGKELSMLRVAGEIQRDLPGNTGGPVSRPVSRPVSKPVPGTAPGGTVEPPANGCSQGPAAAFTNSPAAGPELLPTVGLTCLLHRSAWPVVFACRRLDCSAGKIFTIGLRSFHCAGTAPGCSCWRGHRVPVAEACSLRPPGRLGRPVLPGAGRPAAGPVNRILPPRTR